MAIESFVRPDTLEEALNILATENDRTPIAGGTDLMVRLRAGHRGDRRLLDLGGVLPSGISFREGMLEIGAGATMDSVAASAEVRRLCPALAEAASRVGAWPIQCRATLGGNLVNASPAADTAPPLLAADAGVELASEGARRIVPLRDFFTGPGTTVLGGGEILLSVRILRERAPALSRFEKLGWRREQIISVVSLAVESDIGSDGSLRAPRVAFGSVASTPRRARAVETLLEGSSPSAETIEAACRAVQEDISPIDDIRAPAWYRRMAAAVMLRRILKEVHHA